MIKEDFIKKVSWYKGSAIWNWNYTKQIGYHEYCRTGYTVYGYGSYLLRT